MWTPALALALACARPVPPPPPQAHATPGAGHPGDHAGDHATMHHRFDDAERWAAVFDDPARDAWQRPDELVAALSLAPGSVVADVGAGTGYFNRRLAAAVGPGGRVIAVDIEPSLVAHMAARAQREGTPQVEARLGQPADPGLATGEVDLVLLVDTYHHIEGRVAWFSALRGDLRPGGRLVVVDFKPEGDPAIGPPPAHRLSEAQIRAELEQAGWRWSRSLDILPQQLWLEFVLPPGAAQE